MQSLPFGAVALATAAILGAQNPEGTAPQSEQRQDAWSPSQLAWQELKKQHPNWAADWTLATRTPNGVITDGLQVSQAPILTIEDARPYAQAILDQYAVLLGRGQSTFVEDIAQKVGQMHVFVYDQHFMGLEVIGGRADVRVHEIGRVPMFGSVAVQIPAGFSVNPAIGSEEATARAWRAAGLGAPEVGPLQAAPATRLVIWADVNSQQVTPVRLAWEVRTGTPEGSKWGRSYVDALNGAILAYENDRHECSFGCTHDSHKAAAAERTSESGFRVEVEHDYSNAAPGAVNVIGNVKGWIVPGLDNRDATVVRALSNLRGVRVTIPSTGAFGYTDAAGNFNVAHPLAVPVAITINWNLNQRINGIASQDATPTFTTSPVVTPGVPANIVIYDNAATSSQRSQTNCQFFTTGVNEYCRGIIGALPAATDAITARVNFAGSCNAFYESGLNRMTFYAPSATCVNTSYNTVIQHEWGHGLDDRYGGISQVDGLSEGWGDILCTFHSGQPIVGPNFTLAGGFVRTALNTFTYPAGGGVHQQGQTWMGFAWGVRAGLIAKLGAGPGLVRAENIILDSIVANAANQPAAVREVYLLDDNDANLANGTPNCDVLEAVRITRTLPQIAGLICGAVVSPIANAAAEGNSNNTIPFGFGSATQSYQQSHGDMMGRPMTIVGVSWRRDGALATNTAYAAKTITTTLYLGGGDHERFGTTFATNYTTARTQVATGAFAMPSWATAPAVPPATFTFRIPTTAYAWNGATELVWEWRGTAMTSTHNMFGDAVSAADVGSVNDTSYGSGCISTGQAPNPFQLNSTFTTSRLNNQHTFLWTGQYARASVGAALNIGVAATNTPFPGLCTNIYTNPVIIISGLGTTAAGVLNVGPVSSPYNASWVGFAFFSQAWCLDVGQPVAIKASGSDGSRCIVPGLGGPRVSRLYNTTSAVALTGTVGHSYGLVVRFD
jgi:hypothetical protein